MKKDIYKNIIYNILTTLINIIFPLVIFGIASRVLGADGVGKIAFINSFTSYFVILTSLGIPIYGIREVAYIKNNKEQLSKLFSELFFISVISSIISTILFSVIIFLTPSLYSEKQYYIIAGLLIIMTPFNIEWFFKGYSDFKTIMSRSLLTKVLSLVAVIVLINSKNDDLIYLSISVIALIVSYLWVFLKAKNLVFLTIKGLSVRRHLKPILWIFSTSIAVSIYTQLDTVMLGFMTTDISVGYYTASIKINKVVIGIITSVSVVLMPHISGLIIKNKLKELTNIYNNTINYIIAIAIPATIGLVFIAKSSLLLLSGNDFLPAYFTMQILSLLIIPIALSNLFGTQGLIPFGYEKKLMLSVSVGALINFISNLILIPLLHEKGAAISTLIAEIVVVFLTFIFLKKKINMRINTKSLFNYIFGGVMLFVYSLTITHLQMKALYEFLLLAIGGFLIYLLTVIILKDRFILSLINKIIKKQI